MSLLSKFRTKYGEGVGVELFVSFPELQDDPKTYLETDIAASVSSISANGTAFSANQYIIIGQPGNLKTEIIKISGAPTSTTITLATATQFAHSRGEIIRFIPYNQIIVERSTDAGVNYSALSAVDIRADASEVYIQRTSDAATDYYKFRFYNSTSTLYSAYSDAVIASGYAANTIWSVKDRALDQLNEKKGDLITDKFLNDSIYEARRMVDQDPRVLRWSFRTKFNAIIGQIVPGKWKVSAPADLRDPNTYKNILGLRLGKQSRPCGYQDRVRFNQNYLNVAHNQLNGTVAFGATTVVMDSTADFEDTGDVSVSGSGVGVDRDTFSYTANNRSTNTLSGVTGVPAAGYADNSECWQGATFGLPTAYTIDEGVVYFDVPFNDDMDGRNIVMDYYATLSAITSDANEFDEPFFDMFVSFLKWRIKDKKSGGKLNRENDSDYKDWSEGILRVVSQETNGQRISFIPDVSGYLSESE